MDHAVVPRTVFSYIFNKLYSPINYATHAFARSVQTSIQLSHGILFSSRKELRSPNISTPVGRVGRDLHKRSSNNAFSC